MEQRAIIVRLALATLQALALAACAGNGIGLDANGRPPGEGGGASGALTADFASIQSHVFTPICTACHAGAGAPQGLRLDAGSSYALLVGVPSSEVPALLRVRAGDPDASYLIQKLEGHAAVGAQMPFGGPYLDAATIAVVRQWITDGALASPAAATGAFAASLAAPAPGAAIDASASRWVVSFTAELDPTRIDGGSLLLEQLPAEAGGDPRPVPLAITMPRGNARALLAEPLQALPPGHYRLSAPAAPATGVASLSGERLEGTLAEFDVAAAR